MSFQDLLFDSDSEYCSIAGELTVKALEDVLSDNPERVEDWLIWSDNKRTDSGWFFRRQYGGFEVGYFPARQDKPSIHYDEIEVFRACAQFIKSEIDDMCE